MILRKATAIIISAAMIFASLSFLSAFAEETDSITYTAYGAEETAIAVEDFRLEGPDTYNVFVPAETEKVVFSVTTKDNAEPVFDGGNEIVMDGLTAAGGFTVADEYYNIIFAKQNDDNAVIENIEIVAVGAEDAETALGFDFDPYRQGADERNAAKAPSDTVAIKFNIAAKEGADILINGEAPEEVYAINTKYPVFYIRGTQGLLVFNYKICISVEGVADLYELTLEYGFSGGSAVRKYNLFTEGAEYKIAAPRGVLTVNAEIKGLELRHKNHSELAGLFTDGAFPYENGVALEAVNGSDEVVFTVTLEDAPEGFPDVKNYVTTAYKGGLAAGSGSFALDERAPVIKFYNLADSFDAALDFGCPYDYVITVGETAYPNGVGIPAAEAEAVISVTIGEEVYELPVTLAPEAFLPSLISLSVTPLDADGNEVSASYILEGLETGETVINSFPYMKGTAKYQIAVPQAEYCENVQIPIAPVAVETVFTVTLINENGQTSYKAVFERSDENGLYGLRVDLKDADGVSLNSYEVIDSVTGDKRAATIDFYVRVKDVEHTVTLNGQEAVPSMLGYYKATLDADMQSPIVLKSIFPGNDVNEYHIPYVVPALSSSAELKELAVKAVDGEGAETEATFDGENGFIILPAGAEALRLTLDAENAYKEISFDGRLYAEGEEIAARKGGRLVIRLLSEDGSAVSEHIYDVNHGEYLTGIFEDGELIEGFSPEITDYHFDAPEGKESVTLSVTFPDGSEATFEPEVIFEGGTVTAAITVKGNDGSETVYYVSYEKEVPLLSSETLILNRETGFITGLTFGMKLTELKGLFDNPAENIKFYKNGEETESGNTATGIDVVLVNGNGDELDRMTLVLYGDINGDGRINTTDILAIVINNNTANLSGHKLSAADINGDGRVNSTDILRIILFNNGTAINQNR